MAKTRAKAKAEGELSWKDVEIGCFITEPGSARRFKTGDWRSRKPVFDFSKCNKCTLCYYFCPEGCIVLKKKKAVVDYDYCKGCGICANECPVKAIKMVREEK